MIRFDKLKIVTKNIDCIKNIDTNVFVAQMKGNDIFAYKYKQTTPFTLIILVDLVKNEFSVEFSGKILKDNYPQLINKNNIIECLENINRTGICNLDIHNVINEGNVCKADITTDRTCRDITMITTHLKQSIRNYNKWHFNNYMGNGLVIRNTVTTPKYSKRIIIYDKYLEMNTARNRDFLRWVTDSQAIIEYFMDKVRFELNINTKAQIRQLLNISNNMIQSVMNSQANPLLTVYDEAIATPNDNILYTNKKDYLCELVLRDSGYDLEKVEAKMRALIPKTYSIRRVMQPYIQFQHERQNDNIPNVVRSLIA